MSDSSAADTYAGKLIVGLTGNIATGKSVVRRLAAEHGALAIDADKIVHEIMDHDATMQAAIAVAFGPEVRLEDGRIDRAALGKIVFDDPAAMQDLEAMVHPAVRKVVDERILESEAPIVFLEAIKLLEGELKNTCHQIWVTRCPRQRQLERLRICRGMATDEATSRIKAQPPQEEKVAQADVVIDTNGLMQDTEMQFDIAWSRLPDPASVTPAPRLPLPDEEEEEATKPLTGILTAPSDKRPAPETAAPPPPAEPESEPTPRPDDLQVRRARPSDIPSILLLIQKATDGAITMKRGDLLMALSERGYFIGQIGTDISAIMGYNIDSQVARIDEIYIHPLEMVRVTGTAVLDEIEQSALVHMGQIVVVFLAQDTPAEIRSLFTGSGYAPLPPEEMAPNWQLAIDESQPEGAEFLIKILRDVRAG